LGDALIGRVLRSGVLGLSLFIGQGAISVPARADIQGVASVVDADTLEIHGKRIRLFGIDAPESAQQCVADAGRKWRCGRHAALVLSEKITRSTVSCVEKDHDKYQRIVAICSIRGEDLNGWMVAHGWALAYSQFSKAYVPLEEKAQALKVGIWASQFIDPWDWRRGKRLGPNTASQKTQSDPNNGRTTCAIKGNVSSSGERIYHVPGGEYYSRTQITPSKGERWFCTEGEARAAGWRRSKR
jgi:endonuclease YncB( thermonuclease family)